MNISTPIGAALGLLVCVTFAACGSSDAPSGGVAGAKASPAGAGGMPGAAGSSAGASPGGTPGVAGSIGDAAGASPGGAAAVAGSGGSVSSAGSGTGGGTATAGAGGSGGTGTAGGSSGGGSGASSCSGATLCDGFERTMLGSDWMLENAVAANTVEIVSDKAHSGTSSVHMTFTTARGATFISETKGFPWADNSYWGRVWLFVATGLEAGHHVYIEGSTGVDPTNTGIRALNTQGQGFLATNNAPPDQGGTSPTQKMPQMMWTCFEWHVAAVGNLEKTNLYMNGTEVPGTAASTTGAATNLIKQRVGYERYAAGTAGEMWIDDYAIGPTRINCN